MSYNLDESHTSRNFTPNANVMATFGYPRDIKYITIHHWGNNGQQFDVVRDYLCTNTTPTSAHFVAEDGNVACIVNPLDAAWHAGSAQGNAQSIGIECRPEHTDGDYQTVGELVAWLRSQYGDLPLVPHNYWTSTACPGDYNLARIDAIARGGVSAQSGTITPIQEELVPNQSDKVFDAIDGSTVSLNELLNSIDRKTTAALSAVNGLLSTPVADPTDPKKSYRVVDYIVSAATRGRTNAEAIARIPTTQPAAAPLDVQALAAELAPLLTTNQAHQFIVALGQALPKQ